MMSVQRLTLLLHFIASCTASHLSMGNSFPLGEGPVDYEDVRFAYGQVNLYGNVRYNLVHEANNQMSPGAGAVQEGTDKMSPGVGAVQEGTAKMSSGVGAIQEGTDKMSPGVGAVQESTDKMSTGSGAIQEGTDKMSSGVGAVQEGTDKMSSGVGAIQEGTDKMSSGVGAVQEGTDKMSSGVGAIQESTDKMSSGSGAIQEGTDKMSSGAGAVHVGPSFEWPFNRLPDRPMITGGKAPSLGVRSGVMGQGSGYAGKGSQNKETDQAVFYTMKDNITAERSNLWYVCVGDRFIPGQNQSFDNVHITNSTNSSESHANSVKSNTQNCSEIQCIWDNSNSTESSQTRSLTDYIGKFCCPTFSLNDTTPTANGSHQLSYTSFCNCDEKCALFGDCCPDMMHSCPTMLDSCPDELGSCPGLNRTDRLLTFREQLKKDSYLDVRNFSLSKALEKYPDNLEMVLDNILMEYGSCVQQAGVIMVARCPNTTDGVAKLKCENPASPFIPPITVNMTQGQTVHFRNVFCAQCHGLEPKAMTMWPSQISCSNDYPTTASDLRRLLDSDRCHVEFPRPDNVPDVRFCWNASQRFVCLPSTGDKACTPRDASQRYACWPSKGDKACTPRDEIMCGMYLEQVDQFRNKHCMKCNMTSHPLRPEQCNRSAADTAFPAKGGGGGAAGGASGGILIILDILGTFSTSPSGPAQYLCADDEVYDALTSECHVLVCSFGREPYKGKCITTEAAYYVTPRTQLFPGGWDTLKISTLNSVRWNVSCGDVAQGLYAYGLQELILTNLSFNVNDVILDDQADATGFHFVKKERHVNVTLPGEEGQENIVVYLGLLGNVTMATVLEAENIAKVLNAFVNGNGSLKYFITNMMNSQLCPGLKPAAGLSDFNLQEYKGRVYAVVNSSITYGIFYPLDNIGYHVELNATSGERVATIYPCDAVAAFAANCSVVRYDLNQTKLINGSRDLVVKGVVYEEDAYLIVDGEVFVCSVAPADPNDLPLTVLSYVLTAVSCVLLLAMLAVYIRHAELRTLPGKMTASLAATMMSTFLFNLLTLESVRAPLICPVVAALCHVVTLAQFGWMSAIAVNMALTFGSSQGIGITSPKGIFFRYNLAVWGTSVCLVLTAVVLDIIEPDPQSQNDFHWSNLTSEPSSEFQITTFPRYGFPHCSWFSGAMWTRLVFVIIPFSLTYLNNIVCFTMTLLGIHKASRNSAKVGKKRSDLTRCLIYFKLSTAMGFAWILSLFVSLDPQSQVLIYTFNCCIFLQGMLLFLAFMCNRRVYALVTGKVRKPNSNNKSTSVSMTRSSHYMTKR